MTTLRKFLLLLGPSPPPYGGVSVHLSRLIDVLKNHEVLFRFITRANKTAGDSSFVYAESRLQLLLNLHRLKNEAFGIHDHTEFYQWKSPVYSALFSALMLSSDVPWILTIHDGTFVDRLHNVKPWFRIMIRNHLRKYSTVIVINRQLEEELLSLGIARNKILLIKSFLPLPPVDVEVAIDLKRFFAEHHPVIITTGAFHPTYHFDVVARAFKILQMRFPSAGLIFVAGSFVKAHDIKRVVETVLDSLKSSYLTLSDVPSSTLLAMIRQASVLIRSAFPDGDGLSMREAMHLGVPVVATKTKERPKGVLTYSPADPAELVDAITHALENPPAGEIAETVEIESRRNAHQLLSLYRSFSHLM